MIRRRRVEQNIQVTKSVVIVICLHGVNHKVLSGCLVKTPYSLINHKDRASVQFMVKNTEEV